MRARRAETPARMHGRSGNAPVPVSAGGSAQLATVVSLPMARAARPGAQRRGTLETAVHPHPDAGTDLAGSHGARTRVSSRANTLCKDEKLVTDADLPIVVVGAGA